MELDLYVVGVPQASLSNWVAQLSVNAKAEGIQVIQSGVDDKPDEALPVVYDELCSPPEQRISFCGSDESVLHTFAYKSYCSRLDRHWNVCLHSAKKKAIFLRFDGTLLARKVAHLFYQEGTSDKVYHLYLAQALTIDFYSVISRYGRQGRILQQKEKSFDYRFDDAEKEWNRLYHEKVDKGYKVGRPIIPEQLELELPF